MLLEYSAQHERRLVHHAGPASRLSDIEYVHIAVTTVRDVRALSIRTEAVQPEGGFSAHTHALGREDL